MKKVIGIGVLGEIGVVMSDAHQGKKDLEKKDCQ